MKNSSVKLNNRSDILSVIMARQPVSRKQVSEILGISPAAVTNIVDELISCGLVVEGAFGEASARGGRRPIFLRIRGDAGLVLTAAFRLQNAWISVCDLMGNELFSRSYADFAFDEMSQLLQVLSSDTVQLIDRAGGRERFIGASLSVPGTVEENRILYSPELGLVDRDLAAVLQRELQMPVYIDKDVYLNALGENWMGAGWDYSDFVVVTIGTGIGSAIIINNRIYRGHCSMAGEIGYMITGRDALESGPYTLTDFGYFEKNASLQTLKSRTGMSFQHIVSEAQNGNTELKNRILQNADEICLGLGSVISLLNPQAIILHGSYAAAEPLLADYMGERLRYLTPVPCDVKFSKLGDRALSCGCVGNIWQKKHQMQFLPRH